MSNANSPAPKAPEQRLPTWLILLLLAGIFGFAWWQKQHDSSVEKTEAKNSSKDERNGTREMAREEDKPLSSELSLEHDDADRSASVSNQSPQQISAAAPDKTTTGTAASDHGFNNPSRPSDRTSTNQKSTAPTVVGKGKNESSRQGPLAAMRDGAKKPNSNHRSPGNSTDPDHQDDKTGSSIYRVEKQAIRDLDGNVVFEGTVDIQPTLDRIERGEANRHRNDGTTFQNREGRLPRKSAGYYKEYVQPTPHIGGPGPQRVIIGEAGEVWYTPDHYKTFKQIK